MPLVPDEQSASAAVTENRKARRRAHSLQRRGSTPQAPNREGLHSPSLTDHGNDHLLSEIIKAVASGLTEKGTGYQLRSAPTEHSQSLQRAAFSIPEFAERYGISRATVYRLAQRGLIKLTKIGSRTVILRLEENRLLESLA